MLFGLCNAPMAFGTLIMSKGKMYDYILVIRRAFTEHLAMFEKYSRD